MRYLGAAIGLLVLGTVARGAVRLLYGARGPSGGDQVYLVLTTVIWTVVGTAGVAIFPALVGWLLAIVLWIILLASGATALGQYWVGQRRMLLSILALATEKQLPLGPTLAAFAEECRGSAGRGARRLAGLMREGMPPEWAIAKCGYALPEFAPLYMQVGQAVGSVGAALREAKRGDWTRDPTWQAVSSRILYLLIVLIFTQAVVAFMLVSIVPAFARIFSSFDEKLPEITQVVIKTSGIFADYYGVFVVLLVLGVFFVICAWLAFQHAFAFGWLHAVLMVTPFFKRVHAAIVLRALALATDCGRPITATLWIVAESYPRGSVRRRLQNVVQDVEHGGDWCESLREHGLIGTTDVALLQSAQRVGNLPWALRTVADSGVRRMAYRLQPIVQLLFALTILAIGLLVLVFVVGMFIPLVHLITEMA